MLIDAIKNKNIKFFKKKNYFRSTFFRLLKKRVESIENKAYKTLYLIKMKNFLLIIVANLLRSKQFNITLEIKQCRILTFLM